MARFKISIVSLFSVVLITDMILGMNLMVMDQNINKKISSVLFYLISMFQCSQSQVQSTVKRAQIIIKYFMTLFIYRFSR